MKYLIWDFDGTLGYREGMWTGALFDLLCREVPDHGCTREAIRSGLQSGFPWHRHDEEHTAITTADAWWDALSPVFVDAYRGAGIADAHVERLASLVRHAYTDPSGWRLFDDTLPTLDHLSSLGWTHLILTNHVPELPAILHALDLDTRIARVFNSAVTGYEKPHPCAFHAVLDAIEPDAPRWMIGDSFEADVRGAGAAGIDAVLVRKNHSEAARCCPSLSELVALIV